ncbi:hypothetical protein [Vibrio rumoiensis]|uniref:Uncharacterized protein n=1 Tax=Vibrio rumoiensis TaxID=76258 RepID=A0ABW7J0D4_9VIBR
MNKELQRQLEALEATANQAETIPQGICAFYREIENNPKFADEFYHGHE